jgi:aerobic carbon-monoxide dehydrogenase large subunit
MTSNQNQNTGPGQGSEGNKMGQFALGQSVPRTEDPRLLRGRGSYADDTTLHRQAASFVLRSPHAHAKINGVDIRAAAEMPGVVGILTGEDWAARNYGFIAPTIPRQQRNGEPMYAPARPSLALDRVMLVGDPVAFVVAETVDQAKDASEKIVIDYEALPSVSDTATVNAPGAAVLWDECPDNESFLFNQGDKQAVDAAFARADHVTELRIAFNRITAATMEPRGCIAEFDFREERYTLHTGVQRPHGLRNDIARSVLDIPETHLRVVSGDVGGSFGMKGNYFPEYQLALLAAREFGRPVKWICERSEGMLTDEHDRDMISEAALALDAEGNFLALRVSNVANIGAFLLPGGIISPTMHVGGLAGTYVTPHIHVEVSAVFSNTGCCGPYRGSGRPEASCIVERLIDNAAREMNIDRAELRRRNTIPSDAMPFQTGLSYLYDSGEFDKNLESALVNAEYESFEDRRAEAKSRGRLRGIGISNITEQTSQSYGETVMIKFDPGGTVTVIPGSNSHGQGHDTMYKILISDRLGVDSDDIRVTRMDTDVSPDGGGTFASRTAALGGGASFLAADKIIEKAKRIAAHILESAEADIEFADGVFEVAGTDRRVTIKQVGQTAYQRHNLPDDIEPGLYEGATFAPQIPNFPNGCHICEVEIDPDTGTTDVLRYSVVDDVGTVINALTLEGQIHGGIGQGIGQAFTEHMIFDPDSGQLLTGSFMDYGMPRADNMCSFDLENNPVPTPTNPVGAKGAGEAGNVGALAAIMNAVVDAMSPLGVTHVDMPATPEKLWRLVQEAR